MDERETSVTVKLWGILILFSSCIAFLYFSMTANAEKLTRVETTQKHVVETLMEIKQTMLAIRGDISADVKEVKEDVKEHVRQTKNGDAVRKWQDYPAGRGVR